MPEGWAEALLGDVARVYSGGTPLRAVPRFWNGEIPWVTTAEIDSGYITASRETITAEGLRASAAKVAKPGTLLLAMYGQGKTRGKVAILRIPASMNQACAAIEAGRDVDKTYLLHYLTASYSRIRGMSNAGSQDNLSGDIVKSIGVAIPPCAEQRAIAQALTDADELIGALDRLIAKKRDAKQGMMQELLTGRTRLPGFAGDWDSVRLRDVGSTYGGLIGKDKDDFGTGSALYVTFMEVMSGPCLRGTRLERVRVRKGERQNRIERGDVIFNGSSETPEEVALAAAVDFETSGGVFLNSFCFGFRLNHRRRIDPMYLAYYFRSSAGRAAVFVLAQGATRYNIAKSKLVELAPELPPLAEQLAIAGVLKNADAEIEALERRLESARAVKIGMMQELLTGRTRLPVGEEA